ncbi:thymidine kinase [Dysgonomonas hofstadii]|uniref:Thymidine kinase n=1 Tax=Dysgonomonas hofstadii TaxID=637886 RepID=A0A840CVJ4_9BACT|nr:thymidine kinase [Dysgonomonas hofstadii]MBB4035823.1 thymidine kinase [Dysgonomonas hofstadii]
MSKIIFRYGAMGSSKSAHLLMTGYNLEERGKTVIYTKSSIDTRDGEYITTRAGIPPKKCITIPENSDLSDLFSYLGQQSVIMIDECQFLSENDIDQLNKLCMQKDLVIICYGLRTDSNGNLFAGSKRLFEIADVIEEIKSCCSRCARKATMNLYLGEKKDVVLIGDSGYLPVCRECYFKK